MVTENISTFCRVRPAVGKRLYYNVHHAIQKGMDVINIGRNAESHIDDSHQDIRQFPFRKVFEEDATQEEVFRVIGLPIVDKVLGGYNGTIFAYGQTATGKTFTMLGEKFDDVKAETRGLIPRALSYIFERLAADDNGGHNVYISYLEIYMEKGYDLLNGKRYYDKKQRKLHNGLQEVTCRMDDKRVLLEKLSSHAASSKEDALGLFLRGCKQRKLAETYANETSSRSHCIFTVNIRREDENASFDSKLNFVDLAGSERVGKDHLHDVSLVNEAKAINVSLLFLHEVITAVSDKKQKGVQHIPFRNTMITRMLRDSLVGNFMTSLIATISPEDYNVDETLQTCRFAQSVSKIKTKPIVNKVEDLAVLVKQLQEENSLLRQKIDLLENPPELTDEEKLSLKELVFNYFNDDDPAAELAISGSTERVHYCFSQLKFLGKKDRPTPDTESGDVDNTNLTDDEMRELDSQIDAYLSGESDTPLKYGQTTKHEQYCFRRLRDLVKDFETQKPQTRKKGLCCC